MERPYGEAGATGVEAVRQRRPTPARPLRRSREQRVLGGICGGIAEVVGGAPRTVRMVFALSALPSFGLTFVGYLLLWALIPSAPPAVENELAAEGG